jgi:hypothetical protein
MSFNFDDSDEGSEPETYADPWSKTVLLKAGPSREKEVRKACRNCRYSSYLVLT